MSVSRCSGVAVTRPRAAEGTAVEMLSAGWTRAPRSLHQAARPTSEGGRKQSHRRKATVEPRTGAQTLGVEKADSRVHAEKEKRGNSTRRRMTKSEESKTDGGCCGSGRTCCRRWKASQPPHAMSASAARSSLRTESRGCSGPGGGLFSSCLTHISATSRQLPPGWLREAGDGASGSALRLPHAEHAFWRAADVAQQTARVFAELEEEMAQLAAELVTAQARFSEQPSHT